MLDDAAITALNKQRCRRRQQKATLFKPEQCCCSGLHGAAPQQRKAALLSFCSARGKVQPSGLLLGTSLLLVTPPRTRCCHAAQLWAPTHLHSGQAQQAPLKGCCPCWQPQGLGWAPAPAAMAAALKAPAASPSNRCCSSCTCRSFVTMTGREIFLRFSLVVMMRSCGVSHAPPTDSGQHVPTSCKSLCGL